MSFLRSLSNYCISSNCWLCVKTFCLSILSVYPYFHLFVQLEVPKELISSSQLHDLRLERRPTFIPLSQGTNVKKVHDKETGITQCRLSNGIAVNYKVCHMIHSANHEITIKGFPFYKGENPCFRIF